MLDLLYFVNNFETTSKKKLRKKKIKFKFYRQTINYEIKAHIFLKCNFPITILAIFFSSLSLVGAVGEGGRRSDELK